MTETIFEKWTRQRIKQAGFLSYKMDTGDTRNGWGWPDLLLVGPQWFIELKTPTGRVGPKQQTMHSKLEKLGCKVFVARTKEDIEEILSLANSVNPGVSPTL